MAHNNEGRDLVGIAIIVAISVSAFIGFGSFFLVNKEPADLVTELSAAAYGAIFSVVLMMFLLRKQSEHQNELLEKQAKHQGDLAIQSQQHAKDQAIFKEQVELFKEIVTTVEKIFNDEKVTEPEFKELEFLLLRLQMLVKRDETLKSFFDFYTAIEGRTPESENPLVTKILKEDRKNFELFLRECRLDLGLAKHNLSEGITSEMAESSAESIEPSKEKGTEKDWSGRTKPLALERIKQFLVAVQNESLTAKAELRYTQQYIAIVVEPSEGRKPKICTTFEPNFQPYMNVKINVAKDSSLGERLKTSYGIEHKDGGFKFRVDLDMDTAKLTELEGFIKAAAASKVTS